MAPGAAHDEDAVRLVHRLDKELVEGDRLVELPETGGQGVDLVLVGHFRLGLELEQRGRPVGQRGHHRGEKDEAEHGLDQGEGLAPE